MGRCALILAGLFAVFAAPALAQGGNVFGPTVREGDRSWEWRINAVLDEDGEISAVTRLHYQHAFNDALRLRGVARFRIDGDDPLEPQFARGELQWQYREETPTGYQAALRLDARLNAEGAHRLGVNWTQQWDFADGWRARGIVLLDHEIGAGASEGIRLSYRSRLSRRVHPRLNAGLEAFGRLGNLSDGLPGFDQQRHTAGPTLFGPINARWRWHATSQWAVSEAAQDAPLRVRIYYRF